MRYLRFLRKVHASLSPPTYLEIGVRRGDSLALARSAAVGIDPKYELDRRLRLDEAMLFRETSDEYFARERPLEPFGGRPISLAFIDGMHLVEFALRDFMNVERHGHWSTVVIFDDMFPRLPAEASRRRTTRMWTGDVYKIIDILARHRPDLICLPVQARPRGMLVVLGLDPTSAVLDRRYRDIIADAVVPDPQPLRSRVLARDGVLRPRVVLSSSLWSVLRDRRDAAVSADEGRRLLRDAVRRDIPGIRDERRPPA